MLIVELGLWLAMLMTAPNPTVDFQKDVRPILEQRCQPCHFAGGKMYAQLPFDKPQTVDKPGTSRYAARLGAIESRRCVAPSLRFS